MKHHRLTELVACYLINLEVVKNYSVYTIRNYRSCLNKFIDVVGDVSMQSINLNKIEAFYLNIEGSWNYKMLHLTVLRAFFKFLYLRGIPCLYFDKIEIGKYEPVKREFLERGKLEELFFVDPRNQFISLRNTSLVRVLYSTGCRVSEAARLDRSDVKSEIQIIGKGRKLRVVFLSEEALKVTRNYLKKRVDNSPALFTNQKGRRLSVTMLQKIVRDMGKTIGVKVTPHKIRHSFATHLLQNKVDIRYIQEFLGHSNISTTAIYTHVSNPALKEVFRANHR
jgi:site-specific recombinase XerD